MLLVFWLFTASLQKSLPNVLSCSDYVRCQESSTLQTESGTLRVIVALAGEELHVCPSVLYRLSVLGVLRQQLKQIAQFGHHLFRIFGAEELAQKLEEVADTVLRKIAVVFAARTGITCFFVSCQRLACCIRSPPN